MPEFGLCRHFVARIRDPYIGAKCYINVMLCHAMLCHARFRSCQHQSQQYSLLFSVSALSAQWPYIWPTSSQHCCTKFAGTNHSLFFSKNCFIISAMLFNDLFNEFVQRFCSKMVSFFQEFSFVSKNFLFPSEMFNVRFQRLFFQNFSLKHFFDRISEDFVKDDAHVSKCFQRFVSKSLFEIAHILCNDSFLYIFFT